MNKNKISKIMVLIITMTLIACLATTVFADDSLLDLNSITGNTTTDENIPDITPPKSENSITGNTTTENTTTENKVPDITPNSTTNTNTNTNTSKYEESNIPYAGVESSILMVTAFIVCGIIGVYTFIKLSDYSNI